MVITRQQPLSSKTAYLINALSQRDGVIRRQAYEALVKRGEKAVPEMIKALPNASEYTRWEIARVLGEIGDISAVTSLINLLEDDSLGVRWAASESLVRMGRYSVKPLLEALTKRFDSIWLRNGAHHVFHVLKKRHILNEKEQQVLRALESIAPEATVPWAAEAALETMLFPELSTSKFDKGNVK